MTISPTEFWKRIADCHLASSHDCRLWAAEIAEIGGPQAIGDVDQIVDCLIRTGKLTPYQASAIVQEIPERLSLGPYTILEPVAQRPFQLWKIALHSRDKKPTWLFVVDASFLSDAIWSSHPPSVALCRKHARVHSARLQTLSEPTVYGDAIAIACPVLTGAGIREHADGLPLPWPQSIALIQSVNQALKSLHAASLVHGSIQLDRIWRTDSGEFLLLRDPLFLPRSPLIEPNISCFDPSEDPTCYAAPEFLVPGQQPAVQTDLYALGCLWFHLLTGSAPFAKLPSSSRMEAHATRPITLPDAVGLPTPLAQCLSHLLAKNPESRFATTESFESAIAQALIDIQFDPASANVSVRKPPEVASKDKTTPTDSTVLSDKAAVAQEKIATTIPTLPPAAPARQSPIVPNMEAISASPSDSLKQSANASESKASSSLKTKPVLAAPPTPPSTNRSPTAIPKPIQDSEKRTVPARPSAVSKSGDMSIADSAPTDSQPAPAKKPPLTNAVMEKAGTVVTKAVPPESAATTPQGLTTSNAEPQNVADVKMEPVQTKPKAKLIVDAVVAQDSTPVAAQKSNPPSQTKLEPQSNVDSHIAKEAGPVSPPPPPPLKRKTSGKKPSRGKGKSKRPVWFLPALFGGAFVILLTLVLAFLQQTSKKPKSDPDNNELVNATPRTSTNETVENSTPEETINRIDEQFVAQDDDGSLPWIPPHGSQPFSIEMIPPGAQGFIFIRPEAWLESAEGTAIIDVLETDIGMLWANMESLSGVPPNEMQSVAIGLFPGESGWPRYAYRIELKETKTLEELRVLWKSPKEEALDSKNAILVSGERAYYVAKQPLVDTASIKSFAVGPTAIIRELAELKGAIAPQRKQIEDLLRSTDSKSDLTIVIAPNFLFTDATQVLATYAPSVVTELESLVGTKMRAGLLTTTLSPQWYVELRLLSESEQNAGQVIADVKKQFSNLADKVESTFVQSPPHPYWRAIAARFPQMLRSLQKYQRFGVENGQAISNFYLPASAAPNLILASWMSMQQPMPVGITQQPTVPAAKPLSPEEILNRPITIAFDQESLEVALQAISDETNRDLPPGTKPLSMVIVSAALERDGITRNQQIKEFRHKQKPLRDVLLDLVLRANPVRTVKVPTESDQKLVWILADDPKTPGNKIVQITTRRATTDANIPLPAEFIAK